MTYNNKWYLIESKSDAHGNTSKEKKYIEENKVQNLQLRTKNKTKKKMNLKHTQFLIFVLLPVIKFYQR